MASFLIVLVILGLSVGLLSSWRRNRRLVAQARSAAQVQVDERTNELERANEDLKRDQAELRRRWEYLAEAQRLSHSGTFGWKVRSGELVWSDETYEILGLTRETNPTLDLVFDRIHPETWTACGSYRIVRRRTAWIWISSIEFSFPTASSGMSTPLRMPDETAPAISSTWA